MDNLENTLIEFYEITELTKRLNSVFTQKIKADIQRLGELTEIDRVHLIGILGFFILFK